MVKKGNLNTTLHYRQNILILSHCKVCLSLSNFFKFKVTVFVLYTRPLGNVCCEQGCQVYGLPAELGYFETVVMGCFLFSCLKVEVFCPFIFKVK